MVLLGFLVVCACWSTTWYAIRLCLRGYPALYGAAARFLVAAVIMAAISALVAQVQRRRQRQQPACPERGEPATDALCPNAHLALALAGLANGAGYALLYLAEQTISGGTAAVISASSPFFNALAARLFGLERFLPRRLAGTVLGFIGVAVMMADGFNHSPEHLWAMLLVAVAAAFLWPCYGVILKRNVAALPPLRSSVYLLAYTGLTLLCLARLRGEPLPTPLAYPAEAHAGLLYLAVVGSVVAWTLYLWLLRHMDLSVLATMGLVQPVLALGLDLLAGDSALRWRGYLGTLLVLLGVALTALRRELPMVMSPSAARGGATSGGLSGEAGADMGSALEA